MTASTASSLAQTRSLLQHLWGYPDFRPPQGDVIQTLLTGQDALIILPTGGGKSLCFQLPALMQTGLTLVISPLVALMENQVQDLQQRRLPAALLHSEMASVDRKKVLWALETQQLRLLYLSPETLLSAPVWQRLCVPNLKINGLIVDEAHCVAQWGETFRPAYYRLGAVRPALLQHKPPTTRLAIAAFTATADPTTQDTIERILGLDHPHRVRLSPYRSNLFLTVQSISTPRGRRQRLIQFIGSQFRQSGLVYVRTRHDSEALAIELKQQGHATAAYHAGLAANDRRQIEQDWLKGTLQFVICTNAFGMGISKPNVRWIVHYHAPFLLSEYVQEIGRAGRDGKPAIALMLISSWLDPDDKTRWNFFQQQMRSQIQSAQKLAQAIPPHGSVASVSKQFKEGAKSLSLLYKTGTLSWLDPFHYEINRHKNNGNRNNTHNAAVNSVQPMQTYLSTKNCRWQSLLSAFGCDEEAKSFCCGHCDLCRKR
ncbi:RecQ family ATP-dependent DNA helicase [Myxacorys almedinensis]|uniref:ATP-dependent DNA helicase RecQ n=1 Tax=Myxacorys almedinensis A TaxID=2690445 RepID=A0A8J7Z4Y6_9CYAN|nr:RecQ family ATP-dependent DNA helicase [Myxacorys almedinensis]NDJ19899.1 RecQ family ATP-dependent DNA helicase [Myxacorys almedinensis A]